MPLPSSNIFVNVENRIRPRVLSLFRHSPAQRMCHRSGTRQELTNCWRDESRADWETASSGEDSPRSRSILGRWDTSCKGADGSLSHLTILPSKQELIWLRTRKPLAYQESTWTNLRVSCPYERIIYSVLKHINTTRMHTISWQFIPLIYLPLG